ncbi:MAG: hypothetical protein EA406_08630 [Rhodospirillales bacterium]|nr:MAG: hypothetical protein EA406_08630 [Rhodospirillales bacterium]
MNLLLLNALFAVGWALVWGSLTVEMLLIGYAIGYLALWLTRPLYGPTTYFRRVPRIAFLVIYFLFALVVSSVRVARDVLRPKLTSRPGIVAVPLDVKSDAAITLLANMISLTPGTLSLDVSSDRRVLFVHSMFIDDPDAERQSIKDTMERRILDASQ